MHYTTSHHRCLHPKQAAHKEQFALHFVIDEEEEKIDRPNWHNGKSPSPWHRRKRIGLPFARTAYVWVAAQKHTL